MFMTKDSLNSIKEQGMKSLMLLLQQVLLECGTRCGTSTDLDYKTIEKRIEHEGLSFLTTSLPDFCNVFERALANRRTSFDEWTGWTTRGNLPVFLGGFLDLVFDRESGRLREDADYSDAYEGKHLSPKKAEQLRKEWLFRYWEENEGAVLYAVAGIRQITRLFSKLEIECSKERIDEAYRAFLACERELNDYVIAIDERRETFNDYVDSPFFRLGETRAGRLERIGRLLYGDIYTEMCSDLFEGYPVPRHGPGSTADKLLGNKKFEQTEWPVRLDRSFPAGEYLLPNWRYK